MAAQASTAPSAFVPPTLLADATAHPDAKFAVIVQGAAGRGTNDVAADVAAERTANPGKGKGVKRRFALLSGLSAELTGKQIQKLARHPGIAAITEDSRVLLADDTPTAPASTGAPAISGTAQEGVTLTASDGTWSSTPTALAYEWQRCGTGVRRSAILADSPVGFWPLDGDAADASGHGLAGAATGGVSFGAGAAQFDGLTGAVTVPGVSDQALASGFTIEAWVKVASAQTNRGIAGRWSWLDGGGALLWIDESGHYTLVVSRDLGNYLTTAVSPAVGEWDHVVGTWDGSLLRLFVNGKEIASKPWTAAVGAPTLPFAIGDYDGVGHHLDGSVANVALYAHALPAARVDRHFDACEPIAGATTPSYTATAADVGQSLRVAVTATNGAGSAVATSAATGTVAAAPAAPPPPPPAPLVVVPPLYDVPPTITGLPVVGQALTAEPGTWTAGADAVLSYQWLTCDAAGTNCGDLPTGTERTYLAAPGDAGSTLAVKVTVTDTGGSTSATSAATTVVVAPPANAGAPTVSGAAVVGNTLTADAGTWSAGADALTSYQWLACDGAGSNCHPLAGSTGPTYVAAASDAGSTLAVTVSVADAVGSTSATSAPTAVVVLPPPANLAAPSVSGTAQVGLTLTADPGMWAAGADAVTSYRWLACDAAGLNCHSLPAATERTYVPGADDVGSTLVVSATVADGGGSTSATSAKTAAVVPPPPANLGPPTVSGPTVAGSSLTADPGAWTAGADAVTSYRWVACGAAGSDCHSLPGATERIYVAAAGDVGSTLAVTVTVADAWGSTSATSARTAVVTAPPPANVTAPTVSGVAVAGGTLAADPGTWTAAADAVTSYRWVACDAAASNCRDLPAGTERTYVATADDVGSTLAVTVTVTDAGGSASATSAYTALVTAAAPTNVVAPAVVGTPLEGWMLSADPGSWSGGAPLAYAYRWQLCASAGTGCADIPGATAQTYTLTRNDAHGTVRVIVEASNPVGTADAPSPATAPVAALPNRQLWPYVTANNRGWTNPATPPTIAIVDSGIDTSRADFGGRVVSQVNLASVAPNSPGDGRGHGTFVAGIAAGEAEGYVGAEPRANLVSLDVLNDDGMATIGDVIAAADWIYQHKGEYDIRVANFSLQGSVVTSFQSDPLDKAVEKLWLSGVVVVTAAGNYAVDGQDSGVLYAPGNDPFVITVGATDIAGTIPTADDFAAPWSAFGHTPDGFAKPELSAPGRYIVGPVPPGSTLAQEMPERIVEPGYMQMSGTSFATPMVAGAAARLLAEHPSWTPDQVKGALMLTAAPLNGVALSGGAGELSVASAATVDDPPNPNLPLNQFLVPDPSGGDTPVFDAGAWGSAVSSGAWGSGAWGSGAWGSGAWGSGAWGSGAWGSGAWGSAYWSAGAWGSGVEGAAPPEAQPGAATAAGDALEAGGYWLTSLDQVPNGQ
ncbi:MAG TPA: S8 family serine peptidase [Gaiellaceae bacterium]